MNAANLIFFYETAKQMQEYYHLLILTYAHTRHTDLTDPTDFITISVVPEKHCCY